MLNTLGKNINLAMMLQRKYHNVSFCVVLTLKAF